MLTKINLSLIMLVLFSIFVALFALYAINANNLEENCRAQSKKISVEQVLRESPNEKNQDVIGRKAFNIEQQLLMKCLKDKKVD